MMFLGVEITSMKILLKTVTFDAEGWMFKRHQTRSIRLSKETADVGVIALPNS